MTHIPDEAVQAAQIKFAEVSDYHATSKDMRDAISAALPYLSAPCAIEVKKLEWNKQNYSDITWVAKTPLGNTQIWLNKDGLSDEQPKADAQADFERRILSCVVTKSVATTTKEERHANTARNLIINQANTDLENIINGHDPEQSILNNDVWDRHDKMVCEIEALTKPVDVAAVRLQALEEAKKSIADLPLGYNDDVINGEENAYRAVEALSSSAPAGSEVFTGSVDTDTSLEAAAREAGWALMELVDTIDWHKRSQVSEIITNLGRALNPSYATEIPATVRIRAGESLGDDLALAAVPVVISYTNYRGETSVRRITPKGLHFGATEWHPEPQWLVRAYDHDKQADRDFAFKDFGAEPAQGEQTDLSWLNAKTNFEISHDWPEGGDEEDHGVWKVHSVNGGRSDREWTLIAEDCDLSKAISKARKALAAPTTEAGK